MPDYWETSAKIIRESSKKVLGVASGQIKEDKRLGGGMRRCKKALRRKD